jgi:hypothetical protein
LPGLIGAGHTAVTHADDVPPALGELRFLIGQWEIDSKRYALDGPVIEENSGTAEFVWVLGGRRIQEQSSTRLGGQPLEVLNVYLFDPKNDRWEIARTDSIHDAFGVRFGTWSDGKLVTFEKHPSPDSEVTRRWTLERIDDDRFTELLEFSRDGGKTWKRRNQAWYSRIDRIR